MTEPLREFVPSRLGTGYPQSLTIYENYVEVTRIDPTKFQRDVQRIHYDQIAQVAVRRGVLFAKLVIESRGGGSAVIEGFRKPDAEQARAFIKERIQLRDSNENLSLTSGIPDQIRQLAELREAGIITNENFEAKKRELLDRM